MRKCGVIGSGFHVILRVEPENDIDGSGGTQNIRRQKHQEQSESSFHIIYHESHGAIVIARAILKAALLFLVTVVSFAQSSLDVTRGLQGMVDRHLTEVAKKLLEARAARVAQIRTPDAVRERQDYIRRKLIEEIGGFPEKTPLNAVITVDPTA